MKCVQFLQEIRLNADFFRFLIDPCVSHEAVVGERE